MSNLEQFWCFCWFATFLVLVLFTFCLWVVGDHRREIMREAVDLGYAERIEGQWNWIQPNPNKD